MNYPASHSIKQQGDVVTLLSSNGKELLTINSPKFNGNGNLLTYMIKAYINKLMLKGKFDITQY